MNTPVQSEKKERICPYLGLAKDPETVYSVPTYRHRCYLVKPADLISSEHQDLFCLTYRHINCNVYKDKLASHLSKSVKGDQGGKTHPRDQDSKRTRGVILIGISLIVIVLLVALVWLFLLHGHLGPSRAGSSSMLKTSALMALTIPPSTIQPTQTRIIPTLTMQPPTSTVTPLSPTLTPSVPAFRGLETPIGRTSQLIIHQIRAGESLDLISRNYVTTVEAIQAINYFIPSPLLINALVVVPLNRTDVTGLPPFEAIQVQSDISVESLAQDLDVDVSLLKLYNQLNDGELLKKGDWVLVPRTK